jgi:putative FmdB family regulatory protein
MPIYEYKCVECGKEFSELFKTFKEADVKDCKVSCKHCGSPDVQKLISKNDFQLKGSGWAKDGYKK